MKPEYRADSHGTKKAYTRGCRCGSCTRANTAASRRWRDGAQTRAKRVTTRRYYGTSNIWFQTADNPLGQWRVMDVPDGCRLWMGTVLSNGYGQLSVAGKRYLAHRFAYEFGVGPIPEGLHIDHLCRQTSCVNVRHLEAVTSAVNAQRRLTPERCPQNHEPDWVKYPKSEGRVCKTCHDIRNKMRH